MKKSIPHHIEVFLSHMMWYFIYIIHMMLYMMIIITYLVHYNSITRESNMTKAYSTCLVL